ncbi:MAG TPA: MFS transporter [Anaerolineae bacterium]|nr:MFS transporter [Anaerolineae bacterium]
MQNRTFKWYDMITVNIYYLALTMLSQTLVPLVLPLLVQQFVGETQKATYLGTIRLWGLMVALLAQAFWGMISDRSTSRWGRRRPFILGGTIGDFIFLIGIGLTAGLSGLTGFWVLFVCYLLLQLCTNAAHGATQGLIPDLVPESQRGRFSAVKAIFEVPLPVILVSFTIATFIKDGNLWLGLITLMGFIAVSTALTLLVREEPLRETPPPLNWEPFLRLLAMTAAFTVVILGMGQVVSWLGAAFADIQSPLGLSLLMGAAGLLAMAVASVLGVWVSVRLCVGAANQREHPAFTWWVVNRLAFLVPAFSLSGFALYFLQGRLKLTAEAATGPAAQMMMFVGVFVLLAALPSGWLSDRFGRKPMVALSGVLGGVGTLILLLAPDLALIYVGACIIGLGTGIFYTVNWALGTSLVPDKEAGRYLGISNLAGAGAGAIGTYIGGPIADFFTVHMPQTPGLGYIVIFAIYGLLFLLSTVALAGVQLPVPAKAQS